MHVSCAIFGLVAAVLQCTSACPQSSVTTPPPLDRSFYFNRPVDHPEALSGVWETSDGRGGAVGIHLELSTSVSGDADPPAWLPQSWQYLNLGIFERTGPEIEFGDENYFADSVRGGNLRLEGGHMEMHFISTWKDVPPVDLDLLYRSDGCWHGRFHRGSFDSAVTLCRPTPPSSNVPSPLVGTWSSGGEGRCVHIFETKEGTYTGWSDALEIPGQVIFGKGIPKPHELYQEYGDLAKIRLTNDGMVTMEFGAYQPACCSHHFIGTVSIDGESIRGEFPAGPNQAPHSAIWTKLHNDSCVDPASFRTLRPQADPAGKN